MPHSPQGGFVVHFMDIASPAVSFTCGAAGTSLTKRSERPRMNLRTRVPLSLRFAAILLCCLGLLALTAPLAHAGGVGAVSINDVTAAEGSGGGSTVFTFTVTAASPNNGGSPVVISYSTSDGTAKSTSDYTGETSTTEIPVGGSTAPITIDVGRDSSAEPAETFTVTLTGGATIGDGTGVGTINNDDGTVPTLAVADQSFSETPSGTRDVAVTLTPASTQDVSFTVTTSNGTAVEGPNPGAEGSQTDDFDGYDGVSDTFTIPAASTGVNVPLQVWNANSDEADEVLDAGAQRTPTTRPSVMRRPPSRSPTPMRSRRSTSVTSRRVRAPLVGPPTSPSRSRSTPAPPATIPARAARRSPSTSRRTTAPRCRPGRSATTSPPRRAWSPSLRAMSRRTSSSPSTPTRSTRTTRRSPSPSGRRRTPTSTTSPASARSTTTTTRPRSSSTTSPRSRATRERPTRSSTSAS